MAHIAIDARIINSTTGRYVERLLHYLEQIDTTNHYSVLVRAKDVSFWQPINPNFTVRIADYANYSLNEQLGFWWYLRKLNPDLVHFCMPEQPVLYRGRKVTTIHDLTLLKTYNPNKNWFVYHLKQFVGQFVFRRVISSSRFVITSTKFTAGEIIARFHPLVSKIKPVLLAAETKTTTSKPYPLTSPRFILYVGQQSRYKNIRGLQQAHASLLKKYPDLLLVLVGKIDRPAQQNQAYFESIGAKNIVFTGFVDDAQLNWLYEHTLVYVFASLMEGFGLPGLEAMQRGAPVASSSATCLPEVYGDAALYFDPNMTSDMADAIDRIISDEALRAELIKKGYTRAKRYSWKDTALKTHELYLEALDESL